MGRDKLPQIHKQRLDMSMTSAIVRHRGYATLSPMAAAVLLEAGCGHVPPIKIRMPTPGAFREHAPTQQVEYLRAAVAVLNREEAEAESGSDPARRWMQAIGIEVENPDHVPCWMLMPSLDPSYFAPTRPPTNSAITPISATACAL